MTTVQSVIDAVFKRKEQLNRLVDAYQSIVTRFNNFQMALKDAGVDGENGPNKASRIVLKHLLSTMQSIFSPAPWHCICALP
jgi:hypothetical protein